PSATAGRPGAGTRGQAGAGPAADSRKLLMSAPVRTRPAAGAPAMADPPGPAVAAGARHGVDRRAMAVLSAGHLFTDVSQGSIPALLPFLISRQHLNYASASALILAATISSSVVQPLFGHVSDRRSLPWLMPLGPALGGLGVALVGIAPS